MFMGAQDTFETHKKTCLKAPVLAFADFDKSFLPETDASRSIPTGSICKLISNYS